MSDTYPANESVLHFIWKNRLFNPLGSRSTTGTSIFIEDPGIYNRDSGPDFSSSKIRIGKMMWIGNTEIHIRSSDWNLHNHQNDTAYDSVVLHVVWEEDLVIYRSDGSRIPTLELRTLVEPHQLEKQHGFILSPEPIPCKDQIVHIDPLIRLDMISRCAIERLEKRCEQIRPIFQKAQFDWDATCWIWTARHFGFGINNDAFEQLASIIPRRVFLRCSMEKQLEPLLLGLSGLLRGVRDSYSKELRNQFEFLQRKYQLADYPMHWKLMRTRPYNFPGFRIAQLAAIFNGNYNMFTRFIRSGNTGEWINTLFRAEPGKYWRTHYRPGKVTDAHTNQLGSQSRMGLMINCLSTLVFFYGQETGLSEFKDLALQLQENIRPEDNRKIRGWDKFGIKPSNALESQGLLQLLDYHCTKKLCLNCKIGTHILRNLG